jgi:hypothetical protein
MDLHQHLGVNRWRLKKSWLFRSWLSRPPSIFLLLKSLFRAYHMNPGSFPIFPIALSCRPVDLVRPIYHTRLSRSEDDTDHPLAWI